MVGGKCEEWSTPLVGLLFFFYLNLNPGWQRCECLSFGIEDALILLIVQANGRSFVVDCPNCEGGSGIFP